MADMLCLKTAVRVSSIMCNTYEMVKYSFNICECEIPGQANVNRNSLVPAAEEKKGLFQSPVFTAIIYLVKIRIASRTRSNRSGSSFFKVLPYESKTDCSV